MRGSTKQLLPIFLAIAALTVGSTLIVYWAGMRVTQANATLQRSYDVVAGLEDTLSTLKDAETGQRGFLLTGDEKYTEPYDAAVRRIDENLGRLQQWATTHDVVADEAAAVTGLTREKLDELKLSMELCRGKSWQAASGDLRSEIGKRIFDALRGHEAAPRVQGQEAALAVVRLNVGKQVMDELRRRIADMESQESLELAGFQRQRNRATTLRTALAVALAFFDLAFIGWAFRRIAGDVAALQEAERILRDNEEELARQNEELRQQSEEMARQNEELQQQGEEMARQNEELNRQAEELAQQNEELEKQSEELAQQNEELDRFNRIAVGRELRMIELKKEVNGLFAQLGQPCPYPIESDDGNTQSLDSELEARP